MGWFGHYIPPDQLHELDNYKYTSGGSTAVDRFLSPWWEFLVNLLPLWLAPNLITLIGFLFSCTSFLLIAFFVPSFVGDTHPIIYFLVGFCFFTYQTLDAIDGKQARRTKTSSVLGTLFDHGCDIVTSTMFAATGIGAVGGGAGCAQFLAIMISSQLMQFGYLWWEYYFHVFYSNPGFCTGVTEAQLGVIGFSVLSGVIGTEKYQTNLASFMPSMIGDYLDSFGVKFSFLNVFLSFLIINNGLSFLYMFLSGLASLGFTIKALGATLQIVGFFCLLTFEWFFYRIAIFDFHIPQSIVFLTLTAVYSTTAIRLLLASTCKRTFNPFQWPLIPFFVATAILYWKRPLNAAVGTCLVAGMLAWQVIYLADFLSTSINDICRHLQIRCFTIEPTKKTN